MKKINVRLAYDRVSMSASLRGKFEIKNGEFVSLAKLESIGSVGMSQWFYGKMIARSTMVSQHQ